LNATVFVWESATNVWEPSDVYTLPDFMRALEGMYETGIAGNYFYLGNDAEIGYKYGVANIAAFLAQVMKETLRYNACDLTELHRFVDTGMSNSSFIDSVSGIVNRGCHNPPCASGSVDGGPERAGYFRKVLSAMDAEPTSRAPVAPITAAPVSTPVASPTEDDDNDAPEVPSKSPTLLPTPETVSPTESVEVRACALLASVRRIFFSNMNTRNAIEPRECAASIPCVKMVS